MRGRKPTRPPIGRAVVVLFLIVLAAAAPTRAQDAVAYEFEVTLAPLSLTGSFPVVVSAADGDVAGEATLTTDAKGRLSGSLSLGGSDFALEGKVKFRSDSAKLQLAAKGDGEGIVLKGEMAGTGFTGTTKGKGGVAAGAGTFSLDVSGADPAVARFAIGLVTSTKGKLTGEGTVEVGGQPVDLRVKGKNGKAFKLGLKGKGFKFSGAGPAGASGVVLAWSAKGFGVGASGDGLSIPIITPPKDLAYSSPDPTYEAKEPAALNRPASGGGGVDFYEIEPPLPQGLEFDSATGAISGTPTTVTPETVHTVTARNAAGAATARLAVTIRVNRAESLARQSGPLEDDDRRHFLTRTSFGVTLDDLAMLEKQGLSQYVDGMLTFKKGTKAEEVAAVELINDSDPKGLKGQFPSEADVARWWLTIMAKTDNPFQEVLAMFWHDHFATSSEVLSTDRRRWMKDHIDLWRHEGNGNLRDLLVSMARDWAMLRWLDGVSNQRRAPNENFAREFWELFTLGVDNGYTQEDILEAARAFTGYRERYDDEKKLRYIEFDPERHDTGDKHFFGRTIPGQSAGDDYEAVVDITLEERPVAEFICGKLFSYFCYEDPPAALIDEMAAELRARRWELKPVLKMLLTSEAFFSSKSRHGYVKSPVDFSLGFLRTTGLAVPVSTVDRSLIDQGQRPTQPPTVDGWPEGEFWLSAQGMVERANFALSCITDRSRQEEAGIDVADILPPANRRSAPEVVTWLADLLRVELDEADRTDLVEYLNTQTNSDGSSTPSPFDGTDARHLDERVRGLLYILAQHPTYHIR